MRYEIKLINGVWTVVESIWIDASFDTVQDALEAIEEMEG